MVGRTAARRVQSEEEEGSIHCRLKRSRKLIVFTDKTSKVGKNLEKARKKLLPFYSPLECEQAGLDGLVKLMTRWRHAVHQLHT